MVNRIVGDSGNNVLGGTWEKDRIEGLGGDDQIWGGGGDDVLVGGTGNDVLEGGYGNDIYVFNRGDGQDRILAATFQDSNNDRLVFGDDIAPTDLYLQRLGDDLYIEIRGTTDRITVDGFFVPDMSQYGGGFFHQTGMQQISFANGMQWNREAIILHTVLDAAPLVQLGDGDDTYYASSNVDGGGGKDTLIAGNWLNYLNGGAGDDTLLGGYGPNNVLVGGSGNDEMRGGYGDDLYIGGTGSDTVFDNGGSNTFLFSRGWGADTLNIASDNYGSNAHTTLIFSDVMPGGVQFYHNGDGLKISLAGGGDSIEIPGYFTHALQSQMTITFADGSSMTPNDITMAIDLPQGQTVYANAGGELLYGGMLNDALIGGDGPDVLLGMDGNDTLIGGNGDDMLDGGAGVDTFIPGSGYDGIQTGGDASLILVGRDTGHVTVQDKYDGAAVTIMMDEDVHPSDVSAAVYAGTNLTVKINATGAQVDLHLAGASVQFRDGTVWDNETFLRLALTGDDFDNSIFGFPNHDDVIDGRGGNDMLNGMDGNDRIYGGAGNDLLDGGDGDDALYGGSGDDLFWESPGNNRIEGGTGQDVIRTGTGHDTIVYQLGDGHDTIKADYITQPYGSGNDHSAVLQFGPGIAPADVHPELRYSSNTGITSLVLKIGSTGEGSVSIVDFYAQNSFPGDPLLYGVQRVDFDNGTSWDIPTILANGVEGDAYSNFIRGTFADDIIRGKDGNDTLDGGGGNDTLSGGAGFDQLYGGDGNDLLIGGTDTDNLDGGAGADTYVFNVGDGLDHIFDANGGAQVAENIVRFGAGITPDSLKLTTYSNDIQIMYGNNDQLWLHNAAATIKQFEFADGTIKTLAELNQHAPTVVSSGDLFASEGSVFDLPAPHFADVDANDILTTTVTSGDGSALPSWISYDAGIGMLHIAPGYQSAGFYDLLATATDSTQRTATSSFHLYVGEADQAPVLNQPMPDATATAGQQFVRQYTLDSFTDPDGDPITLVATLADGKALPSWLTFNAADRSFSGTPGIANVGGFDVLVTGTDPGGLYASDVFHVTVGGTNTAPTVKWAANNLTVPEFTSFGMLVPTFQDADFGDVLKVVITRADGSALPSWMNFDASQNWLTGVVSYSDSGVYALKASATDLAGLSVSSNFTVTVTDVNRAPTVAAAAANVHIAEGGQLSAPVAAFTDPDGGNLAVTVTLADGKALPAWMTFDANTGRITGNADFASGGSYAIKATATDAGGLSVSSGFTILVDDVNQAPMVNQAIPDAHASAGTPFSMTLAPATFTDIDAGDTLTLAAMKDTGAPLPDWLHFDAATRTFSGTPGHTDARELDIMVSATDTAGHIVADIFHLSVADVNVAPTVATASSGTTINEGATLSLAVPAFTDANPGDTLAIALTRADGSALPAWMHYNGTSGMLEGTAGFSDAGIYALKATATDSGGLSASSAFTVNVADVNQAPVLVRAVPDFSGVSDELFGWTLAQNMFTDPDAGATLTLSATMDGGAALPSWIVFNPAGRGSFTFFPTGAQVGPHDITVTATDNGGLIASDTFRVTIDQNLAPTITSASSGTAVDEGAYMYLVPAVFADPNQFDATTLKVTRADGSALPAWMHYDGHQYLSGTPGMDDSGSYALKITATDLGGLSTSSAFTVTVNNVNRAPVVANAIAAQSVADGSAFSFTLPASTFSDPDTGDTGTYSATQMPAWLSFNAQTHAFSGTPAYADIGTSSVAVRYTDAGGLSATANLALTVNLAASVTLTGTAGDDTLIGKSNNDTLNGLAGNDILNGGIGADTMAGGTGNDSYFVDNAGDVVTEAASAGTDSVSASISYTLPVNVENLTLSGSAAINGTGNALNNTITGNAGANTLDGGAGTDTLIGGAGNDSYIIDSSGDTLTEAVGGGTDHVMSSVTKTLDSNVEVLTLTGSNAVNGYGNSAANVIKGNAAANSLNGYGGNDVLQGGDGIDTLTDTSGANLLDGGAGADSLYGGTGNELFIGGLGNDYLDMSGGADMVVFNKGDGQDTVWASSGVNNTVSLGHGIVYANLTLKKSGSDLILSTGGTDQMTIKGWYGSTGHTVSTLQVVTVGGADYVPGSANAINDNKVEQFNFEALVAKFDQARAANSSITTWNMASSLASCSTGGSDTAAIGGDLAYHYAVDGNLSAVGTTAALAIVSSASFGTAAQALLVGSALVDGTPVLY